MYQPLHVGLEHPNLLWIVATGLLAFVVGLGVNLYRSLDDSRRAGLGAVEEDTE